MSNRQDQIPNCANEGYATGALRPVSPGLIAIALLLALTASVASASVIESADPARLDRREAPRELTVRWLTSAVARAARDLASNEIKIKTVTPPATMPVRSIAPTPALTAPVRCNANPAIPVGWSAQGLINLPPPSVR